MWEPCILAVLFTTGTMVLPLFFPCTPTECQEVQVRPDLRQRDRGHVYAVQFYKAVCARLPCHANGYDKMPSARTQTLFSPSARLPLNIKGVLYCDAGLQKTSGLNASLGIPSNAVPSLPLYTCRVVDINTSNGNSTTW